MRQAVYTTARFGIFTNLNEYIRQQNGGKPSSIWQKLGASLTAGGLGALVGTPADLILIRMQSDSTLPVDQRRNYKSVFDAAARIPKEEGFTKLWSGGVPTITRAMALNMGMFTTFAQGKEFLQARMPEKKQTATNIASIIAGCVAATLSLPFANAKTKIQKMQAGPDGVMPYKNIFDAMLKTVKTSGATGLWVGLPTYCFRIAPHVMITLIIQDNLTQYIN